MKKRIVILLIGTAMVMTVASGCGDKETAVVPATETVTEATEAVEETTEISTEEVAPAFVYEETATEPVEMYLKKKCSIYDSVKGNRMEKLDAGSLVTKIADTNCKWCKIRYGAGYEGYVYGWYLTEEAPVVPETEETTANSSVINSGTSTKADTKSNTKNSTSTSSSTDTSGNQSSQTTSSAGTSTPAAETPSTPAAETPSTPAAETPSTDTTGPVPGQVTPIPGQESSGAYWDENGTAVNPGNDGTMTVNPDGSFTATW